MDFYPRPPRGGRLVGVITNPPDICISIHALREEGDGQTVEGPTIRFAISIHALREEGDVWMAAASLLSLRFLSTPSARRATYPFFQAGFHQGISIHALREEGDKEERTMSMDLANLYPRPPRGGRPSTAPSASSWWNFYPRPPRGGRPAPQLFDSLARPISIHALREEGDRVPEPGDPGRIHFYPRPPRGGRLFITATMRTGTVFLSTPSARRATPQRHGTSGHHPISIHALREEGDSCRIGKKGGNYISIHALREEGDCSATLRPS